MQERFDHPANDFIVMDEAATIPLNEMDSDSLSDDVFVQIKLLIMMRWIARSTMIMM